MGTGASPFYGSSPRPFVVARDPVSAPPGLARPVVAIGNFDGVHRGHAAVLGRAAALARSLGRPCAALTFEPHPSDFFSRRGTVFRLTPERAKIAAFERLGLDGVVVLSFDQSLAAMTAESFVAEILVGRLDVSGVVVGYDFHFGWKRTGSPEFLTEAGRRFGFPVEVEDVMADEVEQSEAVHSTAVRAALEDGNVAVAARLLGHEWFVVGTVAHGEKRGRTLGFPTANIRLDDSTRLRHGIYAVRLRSEGHTHGGVASFGRRPTFDDGAPLLEVFVFDFDGDLYGKAVEVSFVGWIRPEEKFDGADALVRQMHQDADQARAMLGGGSA